MMARKKVSSGGIGTSQQNPSEKETEKSSFVCCISDIQLSDLNYLSKRTTAPLPQPQDTVLFKYVIQAEGDVRIMYIVCDISAICLKGFLSYIFVIFFIGDALKRMYHFHLNPHVIPYS